LPISECGTGRERNCCDKHPSCASWARRGECSKNPKWMLPNCPLSCHNCETDSEERSTDEARRHWCNLGYNSAALGRKATAATSIHPVLLGHAEANAARIPNGCYLTASSHATTARPTVKSDPRMKHVSSDNS
ncbi:shTK domain protein, partial [Ancylostoma caninum]